MSRPDHPDIKGCSDGGCIFGHPGGMQTNSGCGCAKELGRIGDRGRQMHWNILLLRQEIERLRHAVDHICTCHDTKLCPDCRRLATTARETREGPKGRKMVRTPPREESGS